MWRSWFESNRPEESSIPDGYEMALDTFRRLLLIRSWCPDRTTAQARKYISEALGNEYAEGVILDLKEMWEESSVRKPMICFLSQGSDPTNQIEALAKRVGLGKIEVHRMLYQRLGLYTHRLPGCVNGPGAGSSCETIASAIYVNGEIP